MDSSMIQTPACLLGPNLIRLGKPFRLEAPESVISFDHCEKEKEIVIEDLVSQLKTLSIANISDTKLVSSKHCDKIPEISYPKKNDTEKHISVVNKGNFKNQASLFNDNELLKVVGDTDVKNDSKTEKHIDVDKKGSNENHLSLLMYDELLKFVVETDTKSASNTEIHISTDGIKSNESQASSLRNDELLTFEVKTSREESDSDNENQDLAFKDTELSKFLEETDVEIDSKTEKHIDVNYKGINKKEFSSVINDELLKFVEETDVKSDSNTSSGDKSDSDSDEQVESVNLRERYPKRGNRPKKHKQLRPAPFPQHHTNNYKLPLNSSRSQAPVNINPILENINLSHGGYNSSNRINSTVSESHSIIFPSSTTFGSSFSTSGSPTNQVWDCFSSCVVTNDSVVPRLNEAENVCDNFYPEINRTPCVDGFDNANEKIYSESNDFGCAVTGAKENILDFHFGFLSTDELGHFLGNLPQSNCQSYVNNAANLDDFHNLEEKTLSGSCDISCAVTDADVDNTLDPHIELLSADEVGHVLRNIEQSRLDCALDQNCVDIAEINPSISIFSDNEVKSNLNISSESSQGGENSAKEQENVAEIFNSDNSPLDFNFVDIAEINPSISILFDDEVESNLNISSESSQGGENSAREQANVAEIFNSDISPLDLNFVDIAEINPSISILSDDEVESNLNIFSESNQDSENSVREQENVSEIFNPDISCPSNYSNHTNKTRTCKSEKRKISSIFKTVARDKLFHSASFCGRKWEAENKKMSQDIISGSLGTEKKVIHFLKIDRNIKYKRTNLHEAIKSGNIEEAFCIVEYHKLYHDTIFEINLRDSCNKTVLDYSMEKKMDLLTDYLVENNAKNSICVTKKCC